MNTLALTTKFLVLPLALSAFAGFGRSVTPSSHVPAAEIATIPDLQPPDDLPPPQGMGCKVLTSIGSNFNGTPIPAGRYIWFNAIVKVQRPANQALTFRFVHSFIRFTANGTNYQLMVPTAVIEFDPAVSSASTTFGADGKWHTSVPVDYNGNVFMGGLAWQVPVDLPGGINPVTWLGVIDSHMTGISYQWKWAAAVYDPFTDTYNDLDVKPIDGSIENPYPNSDHAGTPEAFKGFVLGGARGGGGSDYTGSYSGTTTFECH
jgi:hypothetical protein